MAVKATLAVAPEPALRMLKVIAELHEYPQAGEAGMPLYSLELGVSNPLSDLAQVHKPQA